MGRKFIDLTGQRFGRWTVERLDRIEKKEYGNVIYWLCRCDCGTKKAVSSGSLTKEQSKSCGCYQKELLSNRMKGVSYSYRETLLGHELLYTQYQCNSRRRGKQFDIKKEEFRKIVEGNCFYCGAPPQQKIYLKHYKKYYFYNGIDRVNNDLGYILDNCVPCCGTCNVAKMSMSKQEFYSWIERVYNHSILKGRE